MQCRTIRQYIKLVYVLQIVHFFKYTKGIVPSPSEKDLPLWTWECLSHGCVPTHASHPDKIQSLETCNMLCASSMQIWPHPTGPVGLSTNAVPVRSNLFQLIIVSAPSKSVRKHIVEAFELFRSDLRRLEKTSLEFAEWYNVIVEISVNGSSDPRMRMDTDESYTLQTKPVTNEVGHLSAKIEAHSFCGARHALETLMQIIWFDPAAGTLVTLEAAKIKDKPRFSYRGLLLDTARNFIPVADIIRTLDAMAASKLNTFHWHVSDAEAFSLKLTSLPHLAVYGAYGESAMYSTKDVRRIVQRARLRGIRVLIEVTSPAHVGSSWKSASSADSSRDLLLCSDLSQWRENCEVPPCGQLNPLNQGVFRGLQMIYSEIIHLTGVDDIFHVGGDFDPACWKKEFPQLDPNALLLQYTLDMLQRLEYVNGGVLPNLTILWINPLSQDMKVDLNNYVGYLGLQLRHKDPETEFLSGIRTIFSTSDSWDLNTGMPEWYEDKQAAPYNSWQRMYEFRPWMRDTETSTVIGGEVTAWSSMLSVGGLDGRLWPRAAAVAERLWTDQVEGATRSVQLRLDAQRARLVARGVGASPLWSMWCTQNPLSCA